MDRGKNQRKEHRSRIGKVEETQILTLTLERIKRRRAHLDLAASTTAGRRGMQKEPGAPACWRITAVAREKTEPPRSENSVSPCTRGKEHFNGPTHRRATPTHGARTAEPRARQRTTAVAWAQGTAARPLDGDAFAHRRARTPARGPAAAPFSFLRPPWAATAPPPACVQRL